MLITIHAIVWFSFLLSAQSIYMQYFICRPDAVVDPWLKQLWEKVLKMYPLPPGKEIISASQRSASCLN